MRTESHRLTGTLVAFAFVAGWFSASWVSPPTVVTQVRSAPLVAMPPDVPMPRIALDAVTAPDTAPATRRNPFTFSTRPAPARAALADTGARLDAAAGTAPDAGGAVDAASIVAAPTWRVFGIASDADGRFTAVMSGGGDVLLLTVGEQLPDGTTVAEIDAAGVVITGPSGERITLRLP